MGRSYLIANITKNDSLEGYKALYNRGINIREINLLSNESFYVFLKSKVDIRLIAIKENYDIITTLDKMKYFINQVRKNDIYRSKRFNVGIKESYFYMIPIQTVKGTIVGFVCRFICKNFISSVLYFSTPTFIKDKVKQLPAMFGFYKDFEDYDSHRNCKPIVVCEGIKDCIYIKQFYPYVLSNNTSNLGSSIYLLRELTNKVILLYDNDKTGNKTTLSDTKRLNNLGIQTVSLELDDEFKDPANYIRDPEKEKNFIYTLENKITYLERL